MTCAGLPYLQQTNDQNTECTVRDTLFITLLKLKCVTCSSEDDIINVPVERSDPLHNYLSVVDVLGDEARPVADGQDGVLQQRVVLDKLEGLVWQVERAADVLVSHQVVNTLVEQKRASRRR